MLQSSHLLLPGKEKRYTNEHIYNNAEVDYLCGQIVSIKVKRIKKKAGMGKAPSLQRANILPPAISIGTGQGEAERGGRGRKGAYYSLVLQNWGT